MALVSRNPMIAQPDKYGVYKILGAMPKALCGPTDGSALNRKPSYISFEKDAGSYVRIVCCTSCTSCQSCPKKFVTVHGGGLEGHQPL